MTAIDAATLSRMDALGVPHRLQSDAKGRYLSAWLAGAASVREAAAYADVTPAAVRKWRMRDPEFARCEEIVRTAGAMPGATPAEVLLDHAKVAELRERIAASQEICADLGPGPYRGTSNTRVFKSAVYREHRQTIITCARELAAMGVRDHVEIPEDLRPYPRPRLHHPLDYLNGRTW